MHETSLKQKCPRGRRNLGSQEAANEVVFSGPRATNGHPSGGVAGTEEGELIFDKVSTGDGQALSR